jgi:hypothetical protein
MTHALDLLFFGNSYTINNDVADRIARLAVAAGHERPLVVTELEGGQTFRRHIEHVTRSPRDNVDHPSVAGRTWDFVVLQEFSWRPTRLGEPERFRDEAMQLFRMTRDHTSSRGRGVRPVLYQTWARAPGHAFYDVDFAGPREMQGELRHHYRAAFDELSCEGAAPRLARVGDAFESLGFDPSLYDDDLHHASVKGSTLAAMVLFGTIYGATVGAIAFDAVREWAGIDRAAWQSIAAAADGLDAATRERIAS